MKCLRMALASSAGKRSVVLRQNQQHSTLLITSNVKTVGPGSKDAFAGAADTVRVLEHHGILRLAAHSSQLTSYSMQYAVYVSRSPKSDPTVQQLCTRHGSGLLIRMCSSKLRNDVSPGSSKTLSTNLRIKFKEPSTMHQQTTNSCHVPIAADTLIHHGNPSTTQPLKARVESYVATHLYKSNGWLWNTKGTRQKRLLSIKNEPSTADPSSCQQQD